MYKLSEGESCYRNRKEDKWSRKRSKLREMLRLNLKDHYYALLTVSSENLDNGISLRGINQHLDLLAILGGELLSFLLKILQRILDVSGGIRLGCLRCCQARVRRLVSGRLLLKINSGDGGVSGGLCLVLKILAFFE